MITAYIIRGLIIWGCLAGAAYLAAWLIAPIFAAVLTRRSRGPAPRRALRTRRWWRR